MRYIDLELHSPNSQKCPTIVVILINTHRIGYELKLVIYSLRHTKMPNTSHSSHKPKYPQSLARKCQASELRKRKGRMQLSKERYDRESKVTMLAEDSIQSSPASVCLSSILTVI